MFALLTYVGAYDRLRFGAYGVFDRMIDELRIRTALGAQIKKLRQEKGYKQADLALKVGLERTSITNIEAGKQMVTVPLIYKLCEVFEIELAELLPRTQDVFVHKVNVNNINDGIEIGEKTLAVLKKIRSSNPHS